MYHQVFFGLAALALSGFTAAHPTQNNGLEVRQTGIDTFMVIE